MQVQLSMCEMHMAARYSPVRRTHLCVNALLRKDICRFEIVADQLAERDQRQVLALPHDLHFIIRV